MVAFAFTAAVSPFLALLAQNPVRARVENLLLGFPRAGGALGDSWWWVMHGDWGMTYNPVPMSPMMQSQLIPQEELGEKRLQR